MFWSELVLRRPGGSFYPAYWLMSTLCHEVYGSVISCFPTELIPLMLACAHQGGLSWREINCGFLKYNQAHESWTCFSGTLEASQSAGTPITRQRILWRRYFINRRILTFSLSHKSPFLRLLVLRHSTLRFGSNCRGWHSGGRTPRIHGTTIHFLYMPGGLLT